MTLARASMVGGFDATRDIDLTSDARQARGAGGGTPAASVVIVGPAWDGAAPEPGDRSLWYFGRDYRRYARLAAAVGAGRMFHVGAALNEVATRVRPEILAIGRHIASGRCRLSWAASDMAELNPATSDLHLDICRGIALLDAARAGGDHLVVVDDPTLGRALADLCGRAGVAARWLGPPRSTLRALRDVLRRHAMLLRDHWRQRRLMRRKHADGAGGAAPDLCLLTWVDQRTFANGSVLETDRFFGALPAWLRAAGMRFSWLGNPLGPIEPLADAAAGARCVERLDLTAALLDAWSLLRAYAVWLALPFALRRRSVIAGVDVTPLVRRAQAIEMRSPRVMFAAQFLGLARGLKRRGLAPRALLYTFENQPWEKMMLAGFRQALPSTMLVGVQHAEIAAGQLGIHPSPDQWRDGTAPDRLVTIGEAFRDRLIAHGAPPERLVVGGALRYPDILAAPHQARRDRRSAPRRVLAACPMDFQEALELTCRAVIATAGLDDVVLIVNFHPMVDEPFRASIRERVEQTAESRHVSFAEESAQALLPEIDVLLYNSSSTSFEAAAAGVPAIFVASEIGLDLDPMSGQGGMCCRDTGELRESLVRLLRDEELRRAGVAAAQAHLRRCFAAASGPAWLALAQGAGRF